MFRRVRPTRAILDPLSRAAGSDIYVRSERELRNAIGEIARRGTPGRIVIAADTVVTSTVNIPTEIGIEITATGGARILVDDSVSFCFSAEMDTQSADAYVFGGIYLRDLFVQAKTTVGLDQITLVPPTPVTDPIGNFTLLEIPCDFASVDSQMWGVEITGCTVLADGILHTTPTASSGTAAHGAVVAHIDCVSVRETSGANVIDARCIGSWLTVRGVFGSSNRGDVYVAGTAHLRDSDIGNLDFDAISYTAAGTISGTSTAIGNVIVGNVATGSSTTKVVLVGNRTGTIDVSSGTESTILGNYFTTSITAGATDLYQTATDSDPLNNS